MKTLYRFCALSLVLSLGPASVAARELTFEQRVEAQRAIERVLWKHRIWPEHNPGPKPPLEEVVSEADLIARTEDYLRKSLAIEASFGEPVTPAQLQAELDRMVADTKDPELLGEIFDALGRDAFLIAETLARQTLVERRVYGVEPTTVAALGLAMTQGFLPPPPAGYVLPRMVSGSRPCRDDTWSSVHEDRPPEMEGGPRAVWTGSEMIVWGGYIGDNGVGAGARYDPATDTWKAVPTFGSPTARYWHTAVWTGRSMIVWGGNSGDGFSPKETGGRYDPVTNVWTPTSTLGAPQGRGGHSAVWTGSEMLVWGGSPDEGWTVLGTGGRYDPVHDAWRALPSQGAPEPRWEHTAVWTGSAMAVWGGGSAPYNRHADGAVYVPELDRWLPITAEGAPSPRSGHTSVWTGSEMIVWGGHGSDGPIADGARWTARTNAWTPVSGTLAPEPRDGHTAVWTGTEMILWGGSKREAGGRYTPSTDRWGPVASTNAPSPRSTHAAVWTGSEMIVWGGADWETQRSGGRYRPDLNTWRPTSVGAATDMDPDAPAVWTGVEMVVWGYPRAGRYLPVLDAWLVPPPMAGEQAPGQSAAVWTGIEFIVWGLTARDVPVGHRYEPASNRWKPMEQAGAPRSSTPTGVWTGREMIVWGRRRGTAEGTGGRYEPLTDHWTALDASSTAAPVGRDRHVAVWTGDEMIVWGGSDWGGSNCTTDDGCRSGGRYSPSTDTWVATAVEDAPRGNSVMAVWTGREMLLWRTQQFSGPPPPGIVHRYDPGLDLWTESRPYPGVQGWWAGAVWTGREFLVWGFSEGAPTGKGARYDPRRDRWRDIATSGAPAGWVDYVALWTGRHMLLWAEGPGRAYCARGEESVGNSVKSNLSPN